MTATVLVNVDADDLERAVAFYTAAFGLTVGRRFGALAVELVGGSAPIYLLAKPDGSFGQPRHRRATALCAALDAVHLDFAADDLDAAVARAHAAGATLEDGPATHAWGRIAQMADPFGHGVCLIEFVGRGYDEIATG